MDVTVTGRHCQISEEFRTHVLDRITRIDKLSEKVIRVEVQVSASGTKRQPDGMRVEITLRSKGPVIRAEAAANDKVAAFEHALDRLMARLRRAADRRRDHRGHRGHQTIRDAGDWVIEVPPTEEDAGEADDTTTMAGIEVTGDGPLVVREKEHEAAPMSLDRALDEMELVGHDFYLFVDKFTGAPSVVYRRKAYDYGVIRLAVTEEQSEAKTA